MNWAAVQKRLGVTDDGKPGRDTFAALFSRVAGRDIGPFASPLGIGAAVHIPAASIDTPLRLAHFVSQCAHECDRFRTMHEYGGAKYFTRYDGRKDLGNTQPGDGARYHGRGIIQITGRANYRQFGRLLGIDLEGDPELAANPAIAMMVATRYWTDRGINRFADADDVAGVTRRINGGDNGLDDRKALLVKAKAILL